MGQANRPQELSQFGRPNAEQAAEFLEEFRRAGMPANYYFEFELQALPRRGEKRVYTGRMWGGQARGAAFNRIEVKDGAGKIHRFLVQNGPRPAVWRGDGDGKQLGTAALFAPLIPGVEVTAFDLGRGYLYWPNATLQSTNRIVGRPAYAYLFPAPADFTSGESGVASVRAYFDTQFKQPLQSELLDREGKVLKTFSVVSLKTVDLDGGKTGGRQPLPREVDFRNERTRDKTRVVLTAAAFQLNIPAAVFDPAKLSSDAVVPAPERLIRIEQ